MTEATGTTQVLLNLNIAPKTVGASHPTMREAYRKGVQFGTLQRACSKIMYLGDARVGKTSTKKLMMGLEHNTEEPPTFGIKTQIVETHDADEEWKEMKQDLKFTEQEKAAAFYAVNIQANFMKKNQKTPLSAIFSHYIKVLASLLFLAPLVYFPGFVTGLQLHFTPVLVICVLVLMILMENAVIGFTIGNGVAIVIVLYLNYVVYMPSVEGLCELLGTTKGAGHILHSLLYVIVIGLSGCGACFIGAVLALGMGTGMCMPLFVMQPPYLNLTLDNQTSVDGPIRLDRFGGSFSAFFGVSIMLIMFLFGMLSQDKKVIVKISAVVNKTVFLLVLPMACCTMYHKLGPSLSLKILQGFFGGVFFIHGQKIGRSLAKVCHLGHTNRLLTSCIGVEVTTLLAHYLGWTFPSSFKWYEVVQAVAGVIVCVITELVRYHVKSQERYPIPLIGHYLEEKTEGKASWPTRLSLWDFAGDELYHIGHHIFMASHSIYLLVFSLPDAKNRPQWQLERLLYWINSIFSHARHPDALVFLVGTRKAELGPGELDSVNDWLKEKLTTFAQRLGHNRKRNGPLFAVENHERDKNDEDVQTLYNEVWEKATKAEYKNRPIPIKWLKFYELLRPAEQEDSDKRDVILEVDELWYKAKKSLKFKEKAEFLRMLQFYHDTGDIIYRSNDRVLCMYVIMDPQVVIDCCSIILEATEDGFSKHKFVSDMQDFKRSGVISQRLLVGLLMDKTASLNIMLCLLQAFDIIISLNPQIGALLSKNNRYLVPCRLPILQELPVEMVDQIFYFDFGYFYPEAIFLHLMARCYQQPLMSSRQKMQQEALHSNKDTKLYRNTSVFYYSDKMCYRIELLPQKAKQNLIKVHIRKLCSGSCVWDLCRYLDQIVFYIRRSGFKFLPYSCGVLCHCQTTGEEDDLCISCFARYVHRNHKCFTFSFSFLCTVYFVLFFKTGIFR